MKNITHIIVWLLMGALILALAIFIISGLRTPDSFGSIIQSQEYNSTTTGNYNQGAAEYIRTIKRGKGSFGSVVVTTSGNQRITFYNATTSNVNLRGAKATSSLEVLAQFPASQTVGTYTFDTFFTDGLLMIIRPDTAATMGSTTITWR